MQTRNRNHFTTIHTEGALLPVDLLQRISDGDASLDGLKPEDYHLAPGEKLNEAINRSWNRMNGLWGAFTTSRGRLGPGDPLGGGSAGTTLTRERWLLPLFQELGFGRLSITKAVEVDGKSYPISHRWQNIPIHLVGCGLDLDRRTPGAAGAARISPHSLLQEYLNRDDEAQWGLLSNGLGLRILRDNATLTRQAYIEFDLEAMFEGEAYSDFVLLWLLAHQSRFETLEKQGECLLERWSKSAQERGTRALDDLRRGVEEAIVSLGQGFLQHPLNADLRARLKQGDLPAQDYYRQLLRLVYRLIFLFAAEDRDLLLLPDAPAEAKERYRQHYSTARLRALAERQRGSRHHDRFEALRLVMALLGSDQGSPELAIPALGGFLFDSHSTSDLNEARVDNQALLSAVRSLAFITEGNTRRAVDYRNLGPEELGSVYESLLELHPLLNTDAGTFQLTSAAGNERKTTGSYYTPSSLIQVLLDSALDPVIEERVRASGNAPGEQEQALLKLKVCDPACGSGHFLIAAAHRIAGRLAQARAGGDEPPPNELRRALRDVIRHCIYGVDINPMAVELCKVNLWLESLEPGKPLSFLDAHIQCGDSLVGVGPGMDISEVPDEAFNPVFSDDKATATTLKKRNKRERSGQLGFRWNVTMLTSPEDLAHWRSERAGQVEAMPEDDPTQVQAKGRAYEQYQQAQEYIQNRLEFDMWTAAFFWPMVKGDAEHLLAPTQQELHLLRTGGILDAALVEQVRQMAEDLKIFHWELAFPQVFDRHLHGFDCILGNPPWEMMQLEEIEFFAIRDPDIAAAPNKSARQKLIENLINTNPLLAYSFNQAKHDADALNKFLRFSGRYHLTAVGKMNSYALFAEQDRNIISENGQAGLILPTGIATDDTTKQYFGDLVYKQSIVSLFDFENREGLFPGVHRSYKFCLLTISNKQVGKSRFIFFAGNTGDLLDPRCHFVLTTSEISLFNPNTSTMSTFRTSNDVNISRQIYKRISILENLPSNYNPWQVQYRQGLFNMSSDSGLFSTEAMQGYIPLFEGKMVQIYDHRAASVETRIENLKRPGQPVETRIEDYKNPLFSPRPQYWVPETEVRSRTPKTWEKHWFITWKKVTSPTNERTLISSLIPFSGVSDSMYILLSEERRIDLISCLYGNLSAIVLDYLVRQKVGGINLNLFHIQQFPIIPPSSYTSNHVDYITQRILELSYTAYDLKPFAEDLGYFGDPFRWDEERRAHLRAELDAYYARLYGLNRKQLRYVLDPADLTPRELEDILDPWEEVSDPLDPAGYDARRAASDFPGETFRVLKDKEIRQHGEYRTRRLVLEAWERLSAAGWKDTGGAAPLAQADRRPEPVVEVSSKPMEKGMQVEPEQARREPAAIKEEKQETPLQPALSDFGLYKCGLCGKMVMGYDRENHQREKHGGKSVEWKKVR